MALLAPLLTGAGCDDETERDEATQNEQQPPAEEHAIGPDGEPLPGDPLIWSEQPEEELEAEIDAALARAKKNDTRVLLEFVAPWCTDCREVVRVAQKDPAREVLEERYETVYVNVGRFDRHERLLAEHAVDRIATLVVLDPSGERIARTTLEPISTGRELTPGSLAKWLRDPKPSTQPPP